MGEKEGGIMMCYNDPLRHPFDQHHKPFLPLQNITMESPGKQIKGKCQQSGIRGNPQKPANELQLTSIKAHAKLLY